MITLIKSDGTIVLTQPTRVYQGSNISQIILIGAISQNLVPEISFKLPQSGTYTKFDYMTSADIPTGEGISAWSYTIPLTVTQEYGQVDFQTRIKDTNGQVVASGICSFEVERGVPPDTSEIPDIDPFNTIKEIIESIQGDIENSWFESKGVLPYDMAYSYKQNALIYNKDAQGNYRFYCSLTENNSGNELSDTTKWFEVPIMLGNDVDGKISDHNTSNTAHQDIRSLISTLTSRVTQNESNIATNTSNIQQNTLQIANIKTQVEENSSLITDTRNNLSNNYYTKSQTYTKDEVNSLLGTAAGFQFVVVDELPEVGDSTKIYLVPITPNTETLEVLNTAVVENYYEEYIWLADENRYENIGSTKVDLSDYYTKSQIDLLLQNKADNSTVDSLTEIVNSAVLTTKQTLTPEQQAQARSNIGAGSSGFDGDYNSLVNLPTLNTTNTVSQDINENETIQGQINLHKIAKTGNFNDLNDIPQASQSTAGVIEIATDQEAKTGTSETLAINPKQLKVAIDGLGTVFDLKGSVATPQDLPQSNNTIGDVWYVTSESVGYIWLNDGTTDRWEQLGLPIDLSGYVTIASIVNSLTSQEVNQPLSANQGYVLKGLIDAEVQDRSNSDNNLQQQITSNAENLNNKAGLNEQNIFSNTNQFNGQVSLGENAYVDKLHITNPNGGPAGCLMTSDGTYLVFDFSQQGAFAGLNIKSGEFFIDGQQLLPMFINGNYVDVNKNSINSSFDKPLYVTAFFDSSVSSSINDNSGIEIRISPNSDMSGATKVARSSSTNGYPKFEFVCAVIPKGYYFYVEVWGDRDNQIIIKKYEIEGV